MQRGSGRIVLTGKQLSVYVKPPTLRGLFSLRLMETKTLQTFTLKLKDGIVVDRDRHETKGIKSETMALLRAAGIQGEILTTRRNEVVVVLDGKTPDLATMVKEIRAKMLKQQPILTAPETLTIGRTTAENIKTPTATNSAFES